MTMTTLAVTDNTALDTLASAALWYKNLAATNNAAFMPLFFDKHRYLVLKGGGGSGKSIFAGRKILERATTEAGHRFLVIRKVAKTIRESCFRQLCGQISDFYADAGAKINKGDMYIRFPNGSEILFAGIDDPEKLKSIYNITGIWIEEATELEESDFNQLDIRLRGKTRFYKQIIITFNPISVMHWLKKRFFDRKSPKVRTHESTYKDNRFLDREAIETLEAFKETDEYYYNVYCLGLWGVTGKCVFVGKAVSDRISCLKAPVSVGYFEYTERERKLDDIRFVKSPHDGFVRIYKEPIKGVPYVIGADTAGDGSDRFVCQVLDNRTGEQVATMIIQTDEDIFAKQMYCLGVYYGTALIATEKNFSTYPILELERLKYRRQYVTETTDDFTHRPKKSYGFRTDSRTRPIIIAELIKFARDNIGLINDADTLEEMLTFIRNENFRAEAAAGAHDDCVMALAIAHYVRPHQAYTAVAEENTVEWDETMYEDYDRADEDGKEYLIKKWGRPKNR